MMSKLMIYFSRKLSNLLFISWKLSRGEVIYWCYIQTSASILNLQLSEKSGITEFCNKIVDYVHMNVEREITIVKSVTVNPLQIRLILTMGVPSLTEQFYLG